MIEHPCARGLTAACFAAYPAWARQAFAYKMLHILLPKQLTRRLPKGLNRALIGPGAIVPPGVMLPPGAIVPPGFTFPESWVPWQGFDFTTLEDPSTIFPPGWTPEDPLPPGVTITPGVVFPPGWTPADPLPAGVIVSPGAVFPVGWTPADPLPAGVIISPAAVLPAGWTPVDPPPPAFIPGYSPFPTPPESGAAPPIFIPPFEPGPVHPPAPGPSLKEYTIEIECTGYEWLRSVSPGWATARDTLDVVTTNVGGGANDYFGFVNFNFGDYQVSRYIWRFPLTLLPVGAVMVSGKIAFFVSSGIGDTLCIQRAPTAAFDEAADFLRMEGVADSYATVADGYNDFNLSALSLAYCLSSAGGVGYFMTREYGHDYLNSAPADGEQFDPRGATNINVTPEYRPKMTLTYKA